MSTLLENTFNRFFIDAAKAYQKQGKDTSALEKYKSIINETRSKGKDEEFHPIVPRTKFKNHKSLRNKDKKIQSIIKTANSVPDTLSEKRLKDRLPRYERKGFDFFQPDYETKVEMHFKKKEITRLGIGYGNKEVPISTLLEFTLENIRKDPEGFEGVEVPEQRKSKRYYEMLEILKSGGVPKVTGKQKKKKK